MSLDGKVSEWDGIFLFWLKEKFFVCFQVSGRQEKLMKFFLTKLLCEMKKEQNMQVFTIFEIIIIMNWNLTEKKNAVYILKIVVKFQSRTYASAIRWKFLYINGKSTQQPTILWQTHLSFSRIHADEGCWKNNVTHRFFFVAVFTFFPRKFPFSFLFHATKIFFERFLRANLSRSYLNKEDVLFSTWQMKASRAKKNEYENNNNNKRLHFFLFKSSPYCDFAAWLKNLHQKPSEHNKKNSIFVKMIIILPH